MNPPTSLLLIIHRNLIELESKPYRYFLQTACFFFFLANNTTKYRYLNEKRILMKKPL